MDAETAEKINKLAHSLKSLHLVTTIEEAQSRAKEIILGAKGENESVKDMLKEVGEVSEEISKDIKDHNQEKKELQSVQEEVSNVEEKVEDVNVILDVAEESQKQT
ncbi:hypothetical protein HYV79_04300 [Candidatus Woesearchaeota archaeon]|nr:hypothetical protein [Candidatus Woesearchaeota archaeon]